MLTTRYGHGWISITSNQNEEYAWFQVEDDGPGIAKDRQRLFQPLFQGNKHEVQPLVRV